MYYVLLIYCVSEVSSKQDEHCQETDTPDLMSSVTITKEGLYIFKK